MEKMTEKEAATFMKYCAVEDINRGEIKTAADVEARFRQRVGALRALAGTLKPETIEEWVKHEVFYAKSARKYLREREIGNGK